MYRPDWAGYRALYLLWRQDDPRLGSVSPAIWSAWAPVILGYPTLQGTGDLAPHQALVRMAFAHAAAEAISALRLLIRKEQESPYGNIERLLRLVSDCWDERIAATFREAVTAEHVSPQSAGTILRALLRRGDVEARELATQWVSGPRYDEPSRQLALEAAFALARAADSTWWNAVWSSIEGDPDFGEQVIERIAWHDRVGEDFGAQISTENLSALYTWLERRFPTATDPDDSGVHTVTDRERIGQFRDGLLSKLVARGTSDAVNALRSLIDQFPHLEKIQRAHTRARETARPRAWTPPAPREILDLLAENQLRLVRNAEQLQKAVVESLERLQTRLQEEESRAVADLWNVTSRATARGITKVVLSNLRPKIVPNRDDLSPLLRIDRYWREHGGSVVPVLSPKEEVLLSDYVKRHLDTDLSGRGIVVNREVQNRPRDIVDLRAEAVAVDASSRTTGVADYGPLTVIIEVKGCWNKDLKTAMVTQLADRYLQADGLRFGVYLVFWFDPASWDPNDRRRNRVGHLTREELLNDLTVQATSLEARGLAIRPLVLDATLPANIQLVDAEDDTDDDEDD